MPQSLGRPCPGRLRMASSFAFLLFCCLPASLAMARESGSKHWSSRSDADAYILRLGDNTTSTNVSSEDYAGLRAKRSGDFLWFRRAGKTYVIEDQATLEEARALFAPMRALEPEQEDLRRKEEALSEKERELDRQDEDLDRQMDQMTATRASRVMKAMRAMTTRACRRSPGSQTRIGKSSSGSSTSFKASNGISRRDSGASSPKTTTSRRWSARSMRARTRSNGKRSRSSGR